MSCGGLNFNPKPIFCSLLLSDATPAYTQRAIGKRGNLNIYWNSRTPL